MCRLWNGWVGGLDLELGRDDLDRDRVPAADDLHRGGAADQLAGHQALKVVHLLDGDPVDLDDQVLGPQAGAVRRGFPP